MCQKIFLKIIKETIIINHVAYHKLHVYESQKKKIFIYLFLFIFYKNVFGCESKSAVQT